MMRYPRGGLATLLIVAAACGTSTRSAQTTPQPATVHGDIANAKPDSSRFPFTEADVRFMSGMIHHHAQAIAMAKMARAIGCSLRHGFALSLSRHSHSAAIRPLGDSLVRQYSGAESLVSGWCQCPETC